MVNWKKDLQRGIDGETIILCKFPKLKKSNTLTHDLIHENGSLWEIKTDFTTYSNIFLEIISNDIKNTPGGPIQSLSKKVDYYLYRFDTTDVCYCYKVFDLVWFLFNNKDKYKLKSILNKGYRTKGYAIPIEDLKHLEQNLEELMK